ncbi:MAG: pilus assembly protein N-terminal domain-containing protein, partial [Candidatus Margulisiibacteriota bacterium]
MRKLLLLCLALITLPVMAWGTTSMNLDLRVGDQIYVPVNNATRILSVNPAIATGEIYSPQKVLVRAVSLGTTFINIWDIQGLGTIRVKVAPVIPLPTLSAKKLKGAAPLRITYTNGSESNGSTSQYSQNNWGLSTYFHQLRLEGDTAWGKMNSTVRYEGRNALKDFTRLALSLKNNNHNFELGDYTVDLSEITVPHIFLQGVRLQSSLSPSLKTDLFWGNYGNEFWGKSIIGQYLNVRYLTGIGGTLLLGDLLEGSGGYYDSRDSSGAYKSRTVSAKLKLNLPNFSSLSGEYSRGMGSTKAAIAAATLKSDRFYLSAKYRDIDPAFTTPSTFVSFQGIKGYYLNGSLSLSPLLNFQAEYDGYQNQLNTTAADPNYMNRVYRITANLSLAALRNAASYTIWDDDRSGYRSGGKVTGSTLTMNQDVSLAQSIRTNAYARYEPTRYTNTYLPNETYDNFKFIYGATIRLGPVIFMNVEDENNDKKYTRRTPVSSDFIRHRKAELSL